MTTDTPRPAIVDLDGTGWQRMELCPRSALNCNVCLGDGGQSFTWETLDAWTWFNVIHGHCVIVRALPDAPSVLLYVPPDVKDVSVVWDAMRDYFRLDCDLETLCREWTRSDPHFPQHLTGVRLLRQDPLETLFAFICSQNNAIHRIRTLVLTLKRQFGQKRGSHVIDGRMVEFHSFPADATVLTETESQLREWKFGYRARYIAGAARHLVTRDWATSCGLSVLRTLSYREVVGRLCEVPGVGPKVADCIALMSMDQLSAVPIDTHIWRVARERYRFAGGGSAGAKTLTDRTYTAIGDRFRELFGPMAGWAHSVLFTAELRPFRGRGASKRGGKSGG